MASNFQNISSGINFGSLDTDPVDAKAGDFYFNSTTNTFRAYDGTTWSDVATGSSSGGANQTLSNLTSPTAINQNLISAKTGSFIVGTEDKSSGNSVTTQVSSGNASAGSTGSLFISSGNSTSSNSGSTSVRTGTGQGSGAINIVTGNASISSGAVSIFSGTATSSTSGNITISSGTGSSGGSGAVQIKSGPSGSNNSGSILIGSGDAVNSGNIDILPGTPDGGTRGTTTISGATVELNPDTYIGANSKNIKNVLNPVAPQDAATKLYVDTANDQFILNGLADNGTTGWATYADAAGTAPVDGTGGTPAVTFTTTTTNPLSGTNSFLLTKDAANRQGQGASYDFTINSANLAKVQEITFDYVINSGTFVAGNPADRTSAGDSSITIWIYDVTNNNIIQPSTYRLYSNNSTIPDKFSAYFQTASNSTSYRLILHVARTETTAFSLKADNFKVQPSQYVYGTPITDWQTDTVTGSWNTNTTYTTRSRRVGDTKEYDIFIQCTGAPNAANLDINLISTVIDTSKLASGTTVGFGGAVKSSSVTAVPSSGWKGEVKFNSTTSLQVWYYDANSNANRITNALPSNFTNGSALNISFTVPVVGWSSSVQMSDSADMRITNFIGYVASNTALTANVTNIPLTTTKDSHGAWNGTLYTVPTAGDYMCTAVVAMSGGSGGTIVAFVDGVSYRFLSTVDASTYKSGTIVIPNLRAGQTISFRQDTSSTIAGGPGGNVNFSITKITGPTTIAATETIAARYYKSTTTNLTSTLTTIIYDTRVYDSHSAMNTSTGVYTIPTAGLYRVTAKALGPITSTNDILNITTRKNGAFDQSDDRFFKPATINDRISGTSVTVFRAVAGDTIDIQMTTTPSLTMIGSVSGMWFAIERIGL